MGKVNTRFFIQLFFGMSIICAACSNIPDKSEAESEQETKDSDTTAAIKVFICGLWSLDTGNTLNNSGYYFRNDGTFDYVAEEITGYWNIISDDTISLSYNSSEREIIQKYKIDSLNESRMILHDTDGEYLFRKVPFGMKNDGELMNGFSGTLKQGDSREYSFDVPAAKKIEVRLKCDNRLVRIRIFDGKNELTSTPVSNWSGIMVRSGKYMVRISNPENKNSKEAEFDLKVVMF